MANSEILQPVSDVSKSGWTPSTGTEVYPCINGVPKPDDTKFVTSTAIGSQFTVGLKVPSSVPVAQKTVLTVRPRVQTGSEGVLLRATVLKNATPVAVRIFPATSNSFEDYTSQLSRSEIQGLGNYNGVQLKLEVLSTITPCCLGLELKVTVTVDASGVCGCFYAGTFNLAHEPGTGNWDLTDEHRGTYCDFYIECNSGVYTVTAYLRRNELGVPPIVDKVVQTNLLSSCDTPVDWTVTLDASPDNVICPNGKFTFHVTNQ